MPNVLLFVLFLHAASWAQRAESVNLVANGKFSQVINGLPDKWSTSGSAVDVSQTLSVEKDADGRAFARLVCTRCERQGGDSHAMLAQVGHVHLTKDRLYEFSCRLRAQGLASCTIGVAVGDQGWLPFGRLLSSLSGGVASHTIMLRATRDVGPTGSLQIWFTESGTLDTGDVSIVEVAAQTVEFTDTIPATGKRNLVPNGSFELGGEAGRRWVREPAGVIWTVCMGRSRLVARMATCFCAYPWEANIRPSCTSTISNRS